MPSLPSLVAAAVFASLMLPSAASSHTGGALDADGCHTDHRNGGYHCHRGAAAGYAFPDRAAMQEAVRTGKFPEDATVDKEGFFSRLWPFGKKHEQDEGAGEAGDAKASGKTAAAPMTEYEQKLKILQGLFEMGLITREEYEQKRKAVLDEL